MITYYLILLLFVLMVVIFIGLHLSKNIQNPTMIVFFWIIYTLITGTFFNVFLLGYFWSVVRKKTGPIGIRGPKGSMGDRGISGHCSGNASQNIAVFQIIQHLDKIHKNNLVKNDLNPDDMKYSIVMDKEKTELTNKYLDTKIREMVFSVQFESLLEALPLDIIDSQDDKVSLNYLISYLQQTIGEWYHLIYNQKKDWFYQPYDNMNADWKQENPFNEIRKYDIFYWGTQRTFKPLKLETCNSTEKSTSNGKPKILTMNTNDYELAYSDINSGTAKRMNIWRPKKIKSNMNGEEITYYPIGDVVTTGNPKTFDFKKNGITKIGDMEINTGKRGNGPSKTTLMVADGTGDMLVNPIKYDEMWRHEKEISLLDSYEIDKLKDEGRLWKPVAPEGYKCLGDVASNKYNPKVYETNKEEYLKYNDSPVELKCIKEECLEEVSNIKTGKIRDLQWQSKEGDNKIKYNGEIYTIGNSIDGIADNSYNTFRTDNYYYYDYSKKLDPDRDRNISDLEHSRVSGPEGEKFYRIKESCLRKQKHIPKEVESQHRDIGIGWYGLPANVENKYSIFHWMGLIPEGKITHTVNGHKLYIVHYGGPEVNVYNVLIYDKITGEYTNALESQGFNRINIRKLQKNSSKQQFKIVKDKNQENRIYLESINTPRRFLTINDKQEYSLVRKKNMESKFEFVGAFNSLKSLS